MILLLKWGMRDRHSAISTSGGRLRTDKHMNIRTDELTNSPCTPLPYNNILLPYKGGGVEGGNVGKGDIYDGEHTFLQIMRSFAI